MPKPKVNVLLSYEYFTDSYRRVLENHDPAGFRLMIDSGAFTAWTKGKQVDIHEYARFLGNLPAEWEVDAIQLDVIGDHKATLANFLRMLDMGVDVIPVFTRGAPIEDREIMYQHKDYVALGGLVNNPTYLPFVRYFMRTNEGRRVHWLGYTRPPDMKRYRPASVDSSAISGTQRYGAINYYRGRGELRTIQRVVFGSRNGTADSGLPIAQRQVTRDAFMAASRKAGFTMAELKRLGHAASWTGDVCFDHPQGRGLSSFVNYVHGTWHAVEVERNIGTRVYQASSAPNHIDALFKARDFLVERGTLGWATRNERTYA